MRNIKMDADYEVGDEARVLWEGNAPTRYRGKVIRIDKIHTAFGTDENVYETWDNEDKCYYCFDYNQLAVVRAFVVAWCYHSPDAPDFGTCNTPMMTKKEAETYLEAQASNEFNEYCASGYDPYMTHDPDYAKVEAEKDGDEYWEYKIQQVGKEA